MEKQFLVFWQNSEGRKVSVLTVAHPPHDEPRGSHLRDILADELWEQTQQASSVVVNGAIELPPWSASGVALELAVYDGRVASVECAAGSWRVVA